MPPTADERLIGVRAKIERAKQHIRELDTIITLFFDRRPYQIVTDLDPKSGDKVFRFHESEPLPPSCPLIAGDAVHNLRSALDHLAWRLVEANGHIPDHKTQFPICESHVNYTKAANGAKIKGASSRAISVLDSIKPYQGGNTGLWALSIINNFDKHRLLIGAACTIGRLGINKSQGISRFTAKVGGLKVIEDGAEIGRLIAPFNDSDQVNLECRFGVSFVEPRFVNGETIVPLLDQLASLVDNTINLFIPFL